MERVQTIREQIAMAIRGDVLSGSLAAGEPLREISLARRFGVSRGPIRDALLQLTQEGLLVNKPNCGVRVGEAPLEVHRPLMVQLRRQVETFALSRAFESLTDTDDAHWRRMLGEFELACRAGDLSAVVKADMAFHRSIVERGGGAELVVVWLPIVTRMMLRYSRHHSLSESHAEHAAIVQAIGHRDADAAIALLEQHIQ